MSSIGDDLAKQLSAVFALEVGERLQAINEHLLSLEKALGVKEVDRLLAEIFREAHSLKGAARAVNLSSIEAVAHHLESLLLEMQTGAVGREGEVFDLIYKAVDAIGVMADSDWDPSKGEPDVDGLCSQLEKVTGPADSGSNDAVTKMPENHATSRTKVATGSAERDHEDAAPSISPVRLGETVRITTAKLDALFGHVGELLAARVGNEKRLSDLDVLRDRIEAWQRSWRIARPSYRRLLNESDDSAGVRSVDGRKDTAELEDVLTFLEENERQLGEFLDRAEDLRRTLTDEARHMSQVTNDIHDEVRRTRMMPVQSVFQTFPRMVRDLSTAAGKQTILEIEGGETEMDRSVLERIGAPLTHLVRNCVDHGLEAPDVRVDSGKPSEGRILLRAAQRGDSVQIDVGDDGAGIHIPTLLERAVAQEVISPEEAESLDDHEALWLIFRAGLSTSQTITDVSGRGIGLDAVRETVERLQGRIEVDNRPCEGTTFSLILPLTLATTFCLMVEVGGVSFGIPVTNVTRIVRLDREEIASAQAREVIKLDDQAVPVARLENVLGLPDLSVDGKSAPQRLVAAIVASGKKKVAMLVDGLLGTQEVVLKNLPRPLGGTRYVAGASILGTGELVMVLNAAEIVRKSLDEAVAPKPAVAPSVTQGVQKTPSIIIADDSITTRTLERNILESAGFEVRVAADGIEAWVLLQQDDCDLLVSDVNMSRMDGFHLTERIRADARFRNLPVILVTSLDKPEDRERGINVGADAYIVKGSFDQDRLLETIRRLS